MGTAVDHSVPVADSAPVVCDRCGRVGAPGFRFVGRDGRWDTRCLRHALVYPPTFRRALKVAGLVGSILFFINQADVVLTGHLTPPGGLQDRPHLRCAILSRDLLGARANRGGRPSKLRGQAG